MKKNTPKIEFSKLFAIIISGVLFIYSIYAGLGFYSQVKLYYETVCKAIDAGTEYMSISQPDPTLAVTCVTCILASFLTYCLYQFGLKSSLNNNKLVYDNVQGMVMNIATGNTMGAIEDIIQKDNNKNRKNKTPKRDVDDDTELNVAAG